ncbi:MAG: ABC transporter permease [Coriobacteriia bacterium]|nr:ABC transporter permease [Coriobacteriia bacterium]
MVALFNRIYDMILAMVSGILSAFYELYDMISINIRERKITFSLAEMKLKSEYSGSLLGAVWAIVKPITYIGVFWFAIQVGLRGTGQVAGVPRILWMAPGNFVWFFLSETLLGCGKSLITNRHLVTKMVFPKETIPVFEVLSEFIVHFALVIITLVLFVFSSTGLSIYLIQLPYYMFCAFVFGCVVATLISALSAISRDVTYLMRSVNQGLFWLSPILWPLSNVTGIVHSIIMLNPITYLTEGYRNAFVYKIWFFSEWQYMLYFWGFLLILALFTAHIWTRLKDDFADVL